MTTATRTARRDARARPPDQSIPGGARPARRYLTLNGAAMVAIAAVALGVIGLLYLIQTSHVAELGYELSHLQQRRDELAIENARLGYEVARYQSLDAVEGVALEQLGMTHLTKYQFLQVQRPTQEQLSPPPPPALPADSLWQRVWRSLNGIGQANAPATGEPALVEQPEPSE